VAAPLEDYRCKITARTYCAIVAFAKAHGVDKGEVARMVLDEWAVKQIHSASMLARCLRAKGETAAAEGITAASQGIAGNPGDSLEWEAE